jgi:signal transduction histidine kinase
MTGSRSRAGGSDRPQRHGGRNGGGLPLLIALVQTLGTRIAADRPADLHVLGYVLLAGSALVITDRHRWPRGVLVAAAAATVTYHVLHYPAGPTFLALLVAAAVAARAGHAGFVAATAAVSYTAWVVLAGATRGQALLVAAVAAGLVPVTAFVLYAAQEIARMTQEQRRLFDERQRRQASEERLRIAQELHDVVGHHLSLINVRAGVGLHLMDRQPDEARAALDTIKQASAEALREVQSVLNALYPTGQAAPRAPAPGLDRLGELTTDAGLPVHTTVGGEPRPLPAEIDRAAYRIVQEALTNVRRHAGAGATATITIEYRPEELVVQVEDDSGGRGPVAAPAAPGNGISGMRERATALGGSLTAQPLLEGGWQVRARLPLPEPGPELPLPEPGPKPESGPGGTP